MQAFLSDLGHCPMFHTLMNVGRTDIQRDVINLSLFSGSFCFSLSYHAQMILDVESLATFNVLDYLRIHQAENIVSKMLLFLHRIFLSRVEGRTCEDCSHSSVFSSAVPGLVPWDQAV